MHGADKFSQVNLGETLLISARAQHGCSVLYIQCIVEYLNVFCIFWINLYWYKV